MGKLIRQVKKSLKVLPYATKHRTNLVSLKRRMPVLLRAYAELTVEQLLYLSLKPCSNDGL